MKTISIYLKNVKSWAGNPKPTWIFDCNDKTAEKVKAALIDDNRFLNIENVGEMSLHINKDDISYVEIK